MIRSLYHRLPGPIAVRVITLIFLAAAALALLVVTYEWAGSTFLDSGGTMG
jgi:hypothetical protein